MKEEEITLERGGAGWSLPNLVVVGERECVGRSNWKGR